MLKIAHYDKLKYLIQKIKCSDLDPKIKGQNIARCSTKTARLEAVNAPLKNK